MSAGRLVGVLLLVACSRATGATSVPEIEPSPEPAAIDEAPREPSVAAHEPEPAPESEPAATPEPASTEAGAVEAPPPEPLTAEQRKAIVQAIIDASLDAYEGNCPCPYNTMKNGRRCGKTSAYERAGGEAPLCYERDVSEAMVEAHARGE